MILGHSDKGSLLQLHPMSKRYQYAALSPLLLIFPAHHAKNMTANGSLIIYEGCDKI
jgi:hypothetical protein